MHDLDKLNRERRRAESAQLDAARAMLAALEESLPFVASVENPGHLTDRRVRVAQWNKLREVIAAAKAAGIKMEG